MERILIVDDEPDIASSLKAGLEMSGYTIDVFNDPIKALAEFTAGKYALVISDMKMPNMNGLEMVFEMQKLDSKVHVIFLTGFVDMYAEVRKLFVKLNVHEVLQKPIRIPDLVKKINALITSREGLSTLDKVEQRPEVRPDQEPRKELTKFILETANTEGTLGRIAQEMRPQLEFSWEEFIKAISYLAAKGLLQSKGNGFDVLYSLTEAGKREIVELG